MASIHVPYNDWTPRNHWMHVNCSHFDGLSQMYLATCILRMFDLSPWYNFYTYLIILFPMSPGYSLVYFCVVTFIFVLFSFLSLFYSLLFYFLFLFIHFKSYARLAVEGYVHKTVNHSVEFVDKTTLVLVRIKIYFPGVVRRSITLV